MCLIVDANLSSSAFGVPTHRDFKPVIEWLTSDRMDGKLVVGGQLATELNKVSSARRFVRALQQAGRVRVIPDEIVDKGATNIKAQCLSNDSHVVALARVSGARILCSGDKRLHQDFCNLRLVNDPKGRVYQTREHESLLRDYGHTKACRKILNA